MSDRRAARGDLAAAVEAAVAGGADALQVRERELTGSALLDHVEALLAAARRGARARGGTVRVLVNRRVDLCLCAGADGVHLGSGAMPAAVARRLLGADAWIGVSAHSPEEVLRLAGGAASYAHLAPVFAPLSKAAERPPLGLDALARACAGSLPVLAQGGVDATNAAACIRAGAAGVAVTGSLLHAPDPFAAARALRAVLEAEPQTLRER